MFRQFTFFNSQRSTLPPGYLNKKDELALQGSKFLDPLPSPSKFFFLIILQVGEDRLKFTPN
jgi:hypothetical protein